MRRRGGQGCGRPIQLRLRTGLRLRAAGGLLVMGKGCWGWGELYKPKKRAAGIEAAAALSDVVGVWWMCGHTDSGHGVAEAVTRPPLKGRRGSRRPVVSRSEPGWVHTTGRALGYRQSSGWSAAATALSWS